MPQHLKMRKNRSINLRSYYFLMLFSCIALNCFISINLSFLPTLDNINTQNSNDSNIFYNNDKPITSDVAGSELYAEQISAFVSGESSIIRQSFLTNDSNIFENFDYNDPGFLDCNIVIAASNGIAPEMYPSPFTSTIFGSENLFIQNSFFGFLFYNTTHTSNITLLERSRRAFNVLKETFGLQIISMENDESTTFYPFIGYYPDWENMLDVLTANTPDDGYWAAIDKERLSSDAYLDNNHISTVLLMLDSINVLFNGIPKSIEYFNFNISDFELSFMDFSSILNIFTGLFELLNVSSSLLSAFNPNSLLGGNDKVITCILNYEAASGSVRYLGNNQYNFDLFQALNYNYEEKGPLAPSQKTFISLIGALLSEIDVSFYSTDIVSFEPEYVRFSEYIFDMIEMVSFLAGFTIDTSILQNYALGIFWNNEESVNKLTSNIFNPDNDQDLINLLRVFASSDLTFLPTGILNPIESFSINYLINGSQPVLDIKKEYIMNSLTTGSYTQRITVTNKGNVTAYGQDLGQSLFDVSTISSLIPWWFSAFIELIYGVPADEFFFIDENPRFFMIDGNETGTFDTYYPDPFAEGALSFYRPDLADLIMDPDFDAIFFTLGISPEQRQDFADTLSNPESIFNPDNWDLEPGESFTLDTAESFQSELSYTSYYTFRFLQNGALQPYVTYGTTVDSTTSSDALTYNNRNWNLSSSEIGGQNYIQIYFSFENTTELDPDMNADRLRFQLSYKTNLTGVNPFTSYQLEYFNPYSGSFGSFVTIPTESIQFSNNLISFTTIQNVQQYYNISNNYHSIFKITLITPSDWKFSINSVNVTLYDRDLEGLYQNPANVKYSSYIRHNRFMTSSNSIIPVTDHAPIIVPTAYLTYPNSFPGQLNTYYLNLSNYGDEVARNIHISMSIPGIIYNNGDFILTNDMLDASIPALNAYETISLSFDFYTPNSNFISSALIEYNNFEPMSGGSPNFIVISNEIFLSAPIDYRTDIRSPYVNVVKVDYETNWTLAATPGGAAPLLGDHIELNIEVTNEGKTPIDWLEIILSDHIYGFSRLDTNSLEITNLLPETSDTITIILNKTEWNAYYYPGIVNINSTQRSTVQLKPFLPVILAYKHISIVKTFSDMDGDFGSRVTVTINVTNNGNLEFRNITVNDVNGFPKTGFRLQDGVIDKFISLLEPGESFVYSYELSFNQQGLYNISAAKIKYGYLYSEFAYSNSLLIKVRNDWIVNAAWILVPSAIGFGLTALLYWWKHRYDLESADFERREQLMFGTDFRSSSWDKFIIEEHLNQLMEGKQITSLRKREEVF